MATYTIEYTETEQKAMEYASADVNDWIQNAAHERARIAIDEIVNLTIHRLLDMNLAIPSTKEDIVDAAYAHGIIKTAAQRNEEAAAQTLPTG